MLLEEIRTALAERILVLDGAMGTMLQRYGLSGNSEQFNLTNPDIIVRIHEEYIEAGADIIETNTFSANAISQSAYGTGDQARELARAGAQLARKAADAAGRRVFVAGSVGPTGKSLSLAQDIADPSFRPFSFDQMAEAYEEQISGLVEGGVDLFLLETCFDALNTKAALYAISKVPGASEIPVMVSASASDRSGRTLTGQTIEAFYRSIEHVSPLSFGLNCSLGAKDLAPLVKDVSNWASCAVSCYPNAGLPNEMGQYSETPEQTASAIREMVLSGCLNIVGGCCGTTPDHIKAIAEAVKGIKPRAIPSPANTLFVSGLESVSMDSKTGNFINIGERTNVAGSRRFAKLIAAGDYDTALQVAADQIENGASVIDINMDDAMLDSTVEMERFLRHISNDPSVAKAALMVDSSHWETIVAGLKNAQGKCIVNSISLKEGEEEFLRKAREIRLLGAAVVVMAFDEEGQATTYSRKIEICQRAYKLLTETVGFPASDIIFDVNVLSIGTGIAEHSRYGIDFIEAVRWIKNNLPGALTSGGISNLSFAFRGNNTVREAMHSVFLYHAIKTGLDMGIVNPAMLKVYSDIEPELLRCVEDVILDSDPLATDRLIAFAQSSALRQAQGPEVAAHGPEAATQGPEAAAQRTSAEPVEATGASPTLPEPATLPEPVEGRLASALVKGDSRALAADLSEALSSGLRPVDIIEGPLMSGMARVGELFGEGKMFLPQVVKSAKTMKDAVEILQPELEKESNGAASARPKVVIATVKGDVHDIGKNITAIVLTCNGFEVTDLGVMVPKETILDKAVEIGADLICCSGLITPSLFQMEEICREMVARGLSTPLLIGGATTSALHTAVKLATIYDHVFYGSDASSSAVLAGKLISDRAATESAEHEKQAQLRALYQRPDGLRQAQPTSPERSLSPSKGSSAVLRQAQQPSNYLRGAHFANIPAVELAVKDVLPYFDWRMFYAIWGVKPEANAEEAARLRSEAEPILEECAKGDRCRIMLSARFDACHAEGDCIVAADFRLPMMRQSGPGGRSLADFVAPAEYGFDSPMGMFAISVHKLSDDEHMLERSLRLTLAEAASCWLDARLESGLGCPCCNRHKIIKPAAGYASCPDHSLKRDILRLLPDAEKLNITLTETCAMIPDASICGLIFAHPDAAYPDIRRLTPAAIEAYASARGFSDSEKSLFLGHLAL